MQHLKLIGKLAGGSAAPAPVANPADDEAASAAISGCYLQSHSNTTFVTLVLLFVILS